MIARCARSHKLKLLLIITQICMREGGQYSISDITVKNGCQIHQYQRLFFQFYLVPMDHLIR
jgi:hypothetical protein